MTMTCEEVGILVHALIDGELDAGHARAVESHIETCARCAAAAAAFRNLRTEIAQADLRHAAPASLRRRLDAALPQPRHQASRRTFLKGAVTGAAMATAASLALFVFRGGDDDRLFDEAVAAHLRSLQAEHLTDVQSTDRHTVKPWFNGRIDLAPPVIDLAAQGFTLLGGRLDYLGGQPTAALVYRRRVHVINLFVTHASGLHLRRAGMVDGYNIRSWVAQGFDFLAVSDLNGDELQEFVDRFETAAKAAPG